MDLKFGQKICISGSLTRVTKSIEKQTWKIWNPLPDIKSGCIFLGYRYLQNGVREWDGDYGYYFMPEKRFKVALVSPRSTRNPIYVPLDCIESE